MGRRTSTDVTACVGLTLTFKIGAIVRVSVRRVLLQLSSAYPWKAIFVHAYQALRC